MPSANFITRCQNKTVEPSLLFYYDDTGTLMWVDYSTYVKSISAIEKTSELTAGYVDVELDNSDGYFDDYLNDYMMLYHQTMICLYFADIDEYLTLFSGYIESVEAGLKSIKLRIRDRISLLLEKTVGSGEDPFFAYGLTVPVIVWYLLTAIAGLDNTESSDNQDIDYASYVSWSADMNSTGNAYQINCYIPGDSVRACINKIAQLTNSIIWGGNEGRIKFASAAVYAVGGVPITQEYVLKRAYIADLNGMINDITCYYGLAIGDAVTLTDVSISFAGNTITDYNSQFITAGFDDTMAIVVSGTELNDGVYHISSLTAGAIIVSESLQTESSGSSVTIQNVGYKSATNEWAGSVTEQRQYGPADLATTLVEEDRSIWHGNTTSANRYMSEALDRLGAPIREFEITTAMLGFLSDIANVENLLNHYASPNNSIDIHIDSISYDMQNYEVTLKGYWLWSMA